jgi:integrase/recombinase XerD
VEGAHVHVRRRDNPNGAWAKSRRARAVPLDFLVVQAVDQYAAERAACLATRKVKTDEPLSLLVRVRQR